jgi:hypothetical protein
MRILRAFLVSCAVLLCASRPAVSQIVRGTVVDSATGNPLRGVPVLLEQGERSVGTARTDSLGVFSVAAGAGTYRVRVRYFGYRPVLTSPITVAAGATAAVRITLSKVAYALDTVRTTATGGLFNVTSGQAWFTKHEREGKGLFFSGFEVLESRRSACDFFANLPGLRFAPGAGIAIRGGPPDAKSALICRDGRFVGPSTGERCVGAVIDRWGFLVFVDSADLWVRPRPIGPAPPDTFLVPFEKVMGVEIYRNRTELPRDNAIPIEVLSANATCMWVQIWTTIAW